MSSENKWLVKSSDHILGPFEFDRVVEDIFKGEIHLLDEIKGPFERWRPIKDHSLFAAAIERLKATTYTRREGTVTATLDIGTRTSDLTQTKTPTLTPMTGSGGRKGKPEIVEVISDEVFIQQPYQDAPPIPVVSRRVPVSFVLTFLLLIAASVVFMLYDFQKNKQIAEKVSAYGQWTDQGIADLRLGQYPQALESFKQALSISPNDPYLILELAPLMVQFEGQFAVVESMIKNLMSLHTQKDFQKRGHVILALIHSYQGQWREALASLDEALKIDENFLIAQVNRTYVLLRNRNFDEATPWAQKVVGDHPDEAVTHYLYIRSLVEKGVNNKDVMALREALSVAQGYPQKFSDFKQEVLFWTAVAEMNSETQPNDFEKSVNQFLRVDFELTQLHVHDSLLDFQIFNWADSLSGCETMAQSLAAPSSEKLKGFCKLKVHQTSEAKKIFEKLRKEQVQDGILLSLYASALLKGDELSEAKNSLGLIDQVEDKQPLLETLLRGCLLKSDLGCAEALFKGRHSNQISLLYSHWGNSEIHLNSDRKKSKASIQMGLEISPTFAPLLRVKKRIQN